MPGFPLKQHPNAAGRSVLQDWTFGITFMMQSVLITATRGPDGIRKDHPVKVLIRFLRRSFLLSAFDGRELWNPYEPGGGSFTGPLNKEHSIDSYIEVYLRHVDELPHHFQLHMMHAAEILGYYHPDDDVRRYWLSFYKAIVNDAHLMPEPKEKMDRRLGDNPAHWKEAEQVIAEGSGEGSFPADSVSAHRERYKQKTYDAETWFITLSANASPGYLNGSEPPLYLQPKLTLGPLESAIGFLSEDGARVFMDMNLAYKTQNFEPIEIKVK